MEALNDSLVALRLKEDYVKELFAELGNDRESVKCLKCHKSMSNRRMSIIIKCAHVFCFDCVFEGWEKDRSCPYCKYRVANVSKDISIIVGQKEDDKKQISRYDLGSKLMYLHDYILMLMNSDLKARVVIYVDYKIFADKVAEFLKQTKMKHIRIQGNYNERHESIMKIRKSPLYRVAVTSFEDGVEGICLPEATHIIFLHPFCEIFQNFRCYNDLEKEKLGIRMLYPQIGRLTRANVLYIYSASTFEKEIMLERMKNN